jgi:ABC-type cobalamin/Fe3+-siderophores transport system ATPase subunit
VSVAPVRCERVTVRRGGRTVLGPLDLEVAAGQLWGVVGPNGAGKSTLLRVIAGLERVNGGTVRVLGACPRARGRARERIGFLLQRHEFLPEVPFTVEDVIGFGRVARSGWGPVRRRSEATHAIEDALEALGLAPMRHRLYRELSGGERQKVQLARLLAQDADVYLLDEPAAGLDLDWQEQLTRRIGELWRRTAAAVVMVTHEVDRLPTGCDRALLLKDGQTVAAGAPESVLTSEILSELYGCEMVVRREGGRFHAHSAGPGAAA